MHVCGLQCMVEMKGQKVLTWDGSPGETTVSECVCVHVIEDRQAFPWHFSRGYQRTDYTDLEQAYPWHPSWGTRVCVMCVCSLQCMHD